MEKRKSNCESNHNGHDTLRIDLHLKGEHHGINDVANIPHWYDKVIKLEVFDYKKYLNTSGYCPADTEVSRSIYCLGIWESFETLIMLDILRKGDVDNLVVDIGANIGWYSVLASLEGYDVVAIDNDPEILELLDTNIELNQPQGFVTSSNETMNESTPQTYGGDVQGFHEGSSVILDPRIEFFKVDIEGGEKWAYRAWQDLFIKRKVNYALFEISPCFNKSYPDLVEEIASHGYDVYKVPQKGFEYIREFEKEPLETVKKYCIVNPEGRREYVASLYQENFLFIKK